MKRFAFYRKKSFTITPRPRYIVNRTEDFFKRDLLLAIVQKSCSFIVYEMKYKKNNENSISYRKIELELQIHTINSEEAEYDKKKLNLIRINTWFLYLSR